MTAALAPIQQREFPQDLRARANSFHLSLAVASAKRIELAAQFVDCISDGGHVAMMCEAMAEALKVTRKDSMDGPTRHCIGALEALAGSINPDPEYFGD